MSGIAYTPPIKCCPVFNTAHFPKKETKDRKVGVR